MFVAFFMYITFRSIKYFPIFVKQIQNLISSAMARLTNKAKQDIGLSPYALVFRGEKKVGTTEIRVMDFNPDSVKEWDERRISELKNLKHNRNITWINIVGLHDVNVMEQISDDFEIPRNIMSDILDPSTRPKIQEFDKGLFISIKILTLSKRSKNITAENFSLILTDNLLISFREEAGDEFEPVCERIRRQSSKIRTSGSDYLAFALLDVVVDSYIYIIGLLGDKIDNLDDLMDSAQNEIPDKIYLYKREMSFIRKNIKPAYEMINGLAKLDSEFIHKQNKQYYKELQSNISEAIELAENYREVMFDQLSIYHSIMSTRLNEIMRVLTIFSVVFIPITFIVGVYGTNFANIPELSWNYGYFGMWVFIVLITILMLIFFKKKKWF